MRIMSIRRVLSGLGFHRFNRISAHILMILQRTSLIRWKVRSNVPLVGQITPTIHIILILILTIQITLNIIKSDINFKYRCIVTRYIAKINDWSLPYRSVRDLLRVVVGLYCGLSGIGIRVISWMIFGWFGFTSRLVGSWSESFTRMRSF